MYELTVRESFSAAHSLRGYRGKCEELHGHNWRVEVAVSSKRLNKSGMVVDFREIRQKLRKILEGLDHKYLNDSPYFKKNNPSCENIARFIYNKLASSLQLPASNLSKVTVCETEDSCASYTK